MGFSSLNIGVTALKTSQYALETVGHNLANASTDSYSRQRVEVVAGAADIKSFGAVGTGVRISAVTRAADEFLEAQVRSATEDSEYLGDLQSSYEKLEIYFDELSDSDLSSALDTYWSSLGDVADNVEDISTRAAFLANAQAVTNCFNTLDDNLADLRNALNTDVSDSVNRVNALTEEIAKLNVAIVKMEAGGANGVNANDLRDQREAAIKELSGLMNVNVTNCDDGTVTISSGTRYLVYRDQSYELTTKRVNTDGFVGLVPAFAADNQVLNITGGLLGAQLEMRDEIIPGYQDEVDQLAASFLWETNRIVSQGCGLEGYSSLTGETMVGNPEATLDQLQYDFTPEDGTYEIVNGSFELLVYDQTTGESQTVTVEVDLDGSNAEPDTILYDSANPTASNSLINQMQSALDSVAAGAFTVSLDRTGHVSIVSNSDQFQFGFGEDTSGAVAALGLNTLFTGHDAGSIAVSENLSDNPQYLGCAAGFVDGDTTNATALQALREAKVLGKGTTTLDDYYQSIVGRLGIEAADIDTQVDLQNDVLAYAENQRESLSGVNTDEEAARLIAYQRAYQAAAKFITTVNDCYETLINM